MAVIIKEISLKGSKGEIQKEAIFDSGATYSCIHPELAERLEIVIPLPEPTRLPLRGTSGQVEFSNAKEGEKVAASGRVPLNFYIGEYRFSFIDF